MNYKNDQKKLTNDLEDASIQENSLKLEIEQQKNSNDQLKMKSNELRDELSKIKAEHDTMTSKIEKLTEIFEFAQEEALKVTLDDNQEEDDVSDDVSDVVMKGSDDQPEISDNELIIMDSNESVPIDESNKIERDDNLNQKCESEITSSSDTLKNFPKFYRYCMAEPKATTATNDISVSFSVFIRRTLLKFFLQLMIINE